MRRRFVPTHRDRAPGEVPITVTAFRIRPWRRPPTRALALLLAPALALASAGARAAAQPAAGPPRDAPAAAARLSHPVSGAVLDAASGLPIVGATVWLEPLAAPAAAARRATRTDTAGRYRFDAVPFGEWAVAVRALGYAPARLELRLAADDLPALWVGLRARPVLLERVTIQAAPALAFAAPASPVGDHDQARTATEHARQRRFLVSDARVVTAREVGEAITTGEPDLFRTLQRAPGVATRDDYTAELWTRGAPWSQTAVTLDGVPLFNPLHAAGFLGAVSTDVLGSAAFHPGAQPAGAGGGAAATLALATRPGGDTLRGAAELSLLAGRVALDGPLGSAGSAGSWMLGARRSHLGLLARAIGGAQGDSTVRLPYGFGDVAARVDLALAPGWQLTTSGLVAWNALDGDVVDVVTGGRARWGSRAGQVALAAPLGGGTLRHAVAASAFTARATPTAATSPTAAADEADVYHVQAVDNAIVYLAVEGGWVRLDADGAPAMSLGWRLSNRHARLLTAGDWPRDSTPDDTLRASGGLGLASAWAERRWTLGPVVLRTGAVVEAGNRGVGAGAVRVAPRLALRWAVDSALTLSVAASRTHQYEQTVAPHGPGRHGVATSGMFWLVAGGDVPVLRSDLVTFGAERWLGERNLVGITAWQRHTSGTLVPAPVAGNAGDWPRWLEAGQRARGVEVQARRLSGRWTGSAAYAWQQVSLDALGERFGAPWERRHLLQLTGSVRAWRALRLGAAATLASGAPFTPFFDGTMVCDSLPSRCRWQTPPTVGRASALREPGYRGLDLAAEWSRAWGTRRLTAFVQVKNVLDRRNPAAYLDSRCDAPAGAGSGAGNAGGVGDCAAAVHDRLPGLRRTPAAGLRFTF